MSGHRDLVVRRYSFVLFFILTRTIPIIAQDPDFDPQTFLGEAKTKLCGLFIQYESNVGSLQRLGWKHEWISQRLNKEFEILEQVVNLTEVATPNGVFVRRKNRYGETSHVPKHVAFNRRYGISADFYCDKYGQLTRDKIYNICDFSYIKHERFKGLPVAVFNFHCDEMEPITEPGVDSFARNAAGTEGTLWFDENSQQLVKAEGRYYKNGCRNCDLVSEQIPKNTRWSWHLTRFDNKWVFDHWEQTYPVRTSLITGYRRQYLREIHRWFDYEATY